MALTPEKVEYIADLARLEISSEEIEVYREQLSGILDYVARLGDLDTARIPPTSSVLAPGNVLRLDKSRPGFGQEKLMRNAPDQDNGQFRVPPILE
jgi:aspartyl-tRNA(Asn)/glutamyl-tRNA(Gln) amidotransferase subunit C